MKPVPRTRTTTTGDLSKGRQRNSGMSAAKRDGVQFMKVDERDDLPQASLPLESPHALFRRRRPPPPIWAISEEGLCCALPSCFTHCLPASIPFAAPCVVAVRGGTVPCLLCQGRTPRPSLSLRAAPLTHPYPPFFQHNTTHKTPAASKDPTPSPPPSSASPVCCLLAATGLPCLFACLLPRYVGGGHGNEGRGGVRGTGPSWWSRGRGHAASLPCPLVHVLSGHPRSHTHAHAHSHTCSA